MSKKPCRDYTRSRIQNLFGENTSVTLMQISYSDISLDDRIWTITRFLGDKYNRFFAADCAERCLSKIKNVEFKKQTSKLIDRLRMRARDEITSEQMKMDRAAFWAAYWTAYKAACWAVYWTSNRAADRAVYKEACWAVYMAAESSAEWTAERAAYIVADMAADMAADISKERKWQLNKLRTYINNELIDIQKQHSALAQLTIDRR